MRTLGECWWRKRLVFSMFYNTTTCIMEEGVKIKGIYNGKATADYFLLAFFTSFFCFFWRIGRADQWDLNGV